MIILMRLAALLVLTRTLSCGPEVKTHEEYHKDGQVKLSYEYYDSTDESQFTVPGDSTRVYHGLFQSSIDELQVEGVYKHGLRTGHWIKRWEVVLSEEIKGSTGAHMFRLSTTYSGDFVEGTGTMVGINESGIKVFEEHWLRGVLHGITRLWSMDGTLETEISYSLGVVTRWAELNSDGTLRTESLNLHGEGHGTSKEWYAHGTLRSEMHYVDGEKSGEANYFYADGSDSLRCHYENGELQGSLRRWYQNGNLQLEAEYDHGKPIGATRRHYSTGVPSSVKVHLSGTTAILLEKYNPSGNLETRHVVEDEKVHAWEHFDESGNIIKSSGEPIDELLSRVRQYEARIEQQTADRKAASDRQQWFRKHKSKIADLLKYGVKSVSDATIYIVGTWAGGESHSGFLFVSRYVVNQGGSYESYSASALARDSFDTARLKSKGWGLPHRGRWTIREGTYSDTGERYFFLSFIGYDGGLVIDENGDVTVLRNQSLYRVENSRSPYDSYHLYDHQL